MNGQTPQPGFLSLKHAAVWADVSPKTVQRWITAGLPTYRATSGGKVLVKPCEIDRFLQRRQEPQIDIDAMVKETLGEMGLEAGSPRAGRREQRQSLPC